MAQQFLVDNFGASCWGLHITGLLLSAARGSCCCQQQAAGNLVGLLHIERSVQQRLHNPSDSSLLLLLAEALNILIILDR